MKLGKMQHRKTNVPSNVKTFIDMNLKCSLWSIMLIKVTPFELRQNCLQGLMLFGWLGGGNLIILRTLFHMKDKQDQIPVKDFLLLKYFYHATSLWQNTFSSLSSSFRQLTLSQNDWALWLPLLQRVPVWEEICSERGKSLLCEMLWEPVLQHLWGVQEAHWLQHQGRDVTKYTIQYIKRTATLFLYLSVGFSVVNNSLTVHLMSS